MGTEILTRTSAADNPFIGALRKTWEIPAVGGSSEEIVFWSGNYSSEALIAAFGWNYMIPGIAQFVASGGRLTLVGGILKTSRGTRLEKEWNEFTNFAGILAREARIPPAQLNLMRTVNHSSHIKLYMRLRDQIPIYAVSGSTNLSLRALETYNMLSSDGHGNKITCISYSDGTEIDYEASARTSSSFNYEMDWVYTNEPNQPNPLTEVWRELKSCLVPLELHGGSVRW